jgi:hypothetical protein
MKNIVMAALLLTCAFLVGARAQNPDNTVVEIGVSTTAGDHTTCTIHSGQTEMCLANDAACPLWTSNKGGAYINMCPSGGAAPVTSVNGKTGAVTITASTTVTAPSLTFATNGAATVGTPTATTTLQ